MTTLVMPLKMAHDRDPAEIIREQAGDLSGVEIYHNQILVGIYERPEKTRGGIILTEKAKAEDKYQGVVGLVLRIGPAAFQDDEHNKFHGQTLKEGDWVVYRTSDGWKTSFNGKVCRLLEDAHIKARIAHPDLVF